MKTWTFILKDGTRVARWQGGSFVPIWKAERAEEHLPDEMIELPTSLNRTRATRQDIRRIVSEALSE